MVKHGLTTGFASAMYCCVWCYCKKDQRDNLSKSWKIERDPNDKEHNDAVKGKGKINKHLFG